MYSFGELCLYRITTFLCHVSIIYTSNLLIYSTDDKANVGWLTKSSLCFLQENHVNLVHIESRKSKRRNSEFEIFVDCDSNHEQLNEIIQLLRKHVNVVDMEPPDNSCLQEEGKWNPADIV